jgi:hypothetical protein
VPLAVLTVPGWGNSGPDQWQTLWERDRPNTHRVEQDDWDWPDRAAWVDRLDAVVREQTGPVVLAGHSLGAVAAAVWVSEYPTGHVVGLFLVAPADTDAPEAIAPVLAFGPMPAGPLPLPSLIIASDDDPHLSPDRAADLANVWGSELHVLPGVGHINTASGHGPWPEGQRMLDAFCARL